MIYGNKVGGSRDSKTYIVSIVDDNGNEVLEATGIVVDKEEIFDARCEDVMVGRKFASDEGVMAGTNDSPCCRITNGIHEVPPMAEFMLTLKDRAQWDYTTFHAMMWPKLDDVNPTPRVDKVSVDDVVYDNSGNQIATVVKDAAAQTVRFIANDGTRLINNTAYSYLVYYSVCKEELI